MVGINSLHPLITGVRRAEWQLIRDAMDGEGQIKARGTTYLQEPTGFSVLPDDARAAAYNGYLERASFPEFLAPSVSAMIGIVHGKEIIPEIPDALSFLWENADGEGLPLEAFHRRITRELLTIGGYVILADAPEGGGDPYLTGFSRDRLINWDTDWYVLDESRPRRDGFVWKQLKQYRLLEIDGGSFTPWIYDEFDNRQEVIVRARGGGALPRIPVAVGNALDLSPNIEPPPLIGVARAALSIYRKTADQEQALYMGANPTLVAIDGPAPEVVGAGVVHEMYGAPGTKPDLKYVEANNSGLKDRRIEIDAYREQAVMAGARLFESAVAGESGEARRLRFGSEQATLMSIAQSSCMLLERALRNVAMIAGVPEDGIVVPVPKDLLDRSMTPQEFAQLFGVYREGGMSWETFFANGQQGGIFSAEDTPEIEEARIDRATLPNDGLV
jgi:hypothetical protein